MLLRASIPAGVARARLQHGVACDHAGTLPADRAHLRELAIRTCTVDGGDRGEGGADRRTRAATVIRPAWALDMLPVYLEEPGS